MIVAFLSARFALSDMSDCRNTWKWTVVTDCLPFHGLERYKSKVNQKLGLVFAFVVGFLCALFLLFLSFLKKLFLKSSFKTKEKPPKHHLCSLYPYSSLSLSVEME